LQHIQSFAAADFADDDSIWPHAQRIANQVADGNSILPSEFGGLVSMRTT
jgi:hypothetical protein